MSGVRLPARIAPLREWPERLLLATGNGGKAAELTAMLREALGPEMEILTPAALPSLPRPPETLESARTFTGNAILKAAWYAEASGLACLADDSGLCVDALGGAPGLLSARWAGPTDADRNAALLRRLGEVGASRPDQRRATFVSSVCLYQPGEPPALLTALGTVEGVIATICSAAGSGFGYDPLFCLPSEARTLAELGAEGKARFSHRAAAVRSLLAQGPARKEDRAPG